MANIVLSGDTSGAITLSAPAVSGSNTQTLAAVSGTLAPIVSGTAVASTSGTSIDFTGIPAYAKRITVMFSGVSTNGTSKPQLQLGSGTVTTSGYLGSFGGYQSTASGATSNYTSGFGIESASATQALHGAFVVTNVSGNIWICTSSFGASGANVAFFGGGSISLAGVLDRIRVTTVNGTDTFDAGTINILYE